MAMVLPAFVAELEAAAAGTCPERMLLAAMLARAVCDLKSGSKDELISALQWFQRTKRAKKLHYHLPYSYVIETLALSARRLAELERLVEEGAHRLDMMRGIIGKNRKRKGLYIEEDKYVKRAKNGVAVIRFRRSRVTLT